MVATFLIVNTLILYFERSPTMDNLLKYASIFSFYGILLSSIFISYLLRQNPKFSKNFLILGMLLSLINIENSIPLIVLYPLLSLPLLGFTISMVYFGREILNKTVIIKTSLLISIALFIAVFYSFLDLISMGFISIFIALSILAIDWSVNLEVVPSPVFFKPTTREYPMS